MRKKVVAPVMLAGLSIFVSCSTITVFKFDTAFETRQALDKALYGLEAVTLESGVYVIGGAGPGGAGGLSGDILRFDQEIWSVTKVGETPIPRRYHTTVGLKDNLYIISGETAIPDLLGWQYVATDALESWNAATGEIWLLSPIPTPRLMAGSVMHDGKIYVIGGSALFPAPGRFKAIRRYLKRMEIYDIATDSWRRGPEMSLGRQTAAAYWDGKIYVVGGYDGNPLRNFDVYDIATGSWETYPDLPFKISAHSCAVKGDYLYLFGDYEKLNFVARYDFRSGKWIQIKSNFSGNRHNAAAIAGNQIIVFGGNRDSILGGVKDVQVFTPPADDVTVPMKIYP